MKQKVIIFIIALIYLIAAYYFYCNQFVLYVPVIRNYDMDQTYLNLPEMNDENHKKAMIHILERYGRPYKITDNQLLIKRKLAEDLDLLSNFSRKAILLSQEQSRSIP